MYKRGFLVTSSKDVSMEGWGKVDLKTLTAWVHPMCNNYKVEKENVSMLVLGEVIDPFNKINDKSEILGLLCERFSYSNDKFFDYLDKLSGRFVLVIEDDNNSYILQDAAGNRSLLYDKEFRYFSSHAELIADLTNDDWHEESQDFISKPGYIKIGAHFPGLLTIYKNIYKSIPNTLIDVNDKTIKRFFPREILSERKIDTSFLEEISGVLQNQIELLAGKYKLAQSLTAGLDSRITLAASKKIKNDIYYYTIHARKDHEKEIKVVQELCEHLNIKHHVLKENGTIDDRFIEEFLKSNSYMTSEDRAVLTKVLVENYPSDRLHLKSSLSEIGRAFYYEYRAFLPSMPKAKDLTKFYGYNSNSGFVKNAFEEFVRKTEFTKDKLYNYNPYDLHYWEYRMGSWQSQGLKEADIAQDTFILFNNRELLKMMLSVPFADRRKSKLQYSLIDHMWKEALDIDVNPWVKDGNSAELKRIIRGLKFRFG